MTQTLIDCRLISIRGSPAAGSAGLEEDNLTFSCWFDRARGAGNSRSLALLLWRLEPGTITVMSFCHRHYTFLVRTWIDPKGTFIEFHSSHRQIRHILYNFCIFHSCSVLRGNTHMMQAYEILILKVELFLTIKDMHHFDIYKFRWSCGSHMGITPMGIIHSKVINRKVLQMWESTVLVLKNEVHLMHTNKFSLNIASNSIWLCPCFQRQLYTPAGYV